MALFSNSCQKLFLIFFFHINISFHLLALMSNLHSERENIDSLSSVHSFLPALENVLIILAMTSSVGFDTEYNVGVVFFPILCACVFFFFSLKDNHDFSQQNHGHKCHKGARIFERDPNTNRSQLND